MDGHRELLKQGTNSPNRNAQLGRSLIGETAEVTLNCRRMTKRLSYTTQSHAWPAGSIQCVVYLEKNDMRAARNRWPAKALVAMLLASEPGWFATGIS